MKRSKNFKITLVVTGALLVLLGILLSASILLRHVLDAASKSYNGIFGKLPEKKVAEIIDGKLHLYETLSEPRVRSQNESLITTVENYELPFPTVTNPADFFTKYDFPKVFLFDHAVDVDPSWTKVNNNFGMVFYEDPSFTYAPLNNPLNDIEKRMFGTKMTLDSNFVQFRDYKGGAPLPDDYPFSITFFQEACHPEKSLEWITKREFIFTRFANDWGESGKFYYLGKYKINNPRWTEGWVYFWILDDDGIADDNSMYVIDYSLVDQYDRKYRHTVRAKKDYLQDNYDLIADLLGSFDVTERYRIFMYQKCSFETEEHYFTRLDTKLEALHKMGIFYMLPQDIQRAKDAWDSLHTSTE